ncbi:uncharacterized protein Apoltp [Prorops nasuta]|uniref:uncharacterized protein Apoltp n=1 Tax=Prorops nasuta TaxID=863751 RepID=UPI0034CFCB74
MAASVFPFLVGFLLLVSFCAGEIVRDPRLCSRTKCNVPADRKFKYEEGVYYRYRYSVDVSTNLGEAKEGQARNESNLFIDGIVTLNFGSPCEGQVRFQRTSISQDRSSYNSEFPDRAGAEFKANLEKYVLRFGYDDGQVNELCPDPREHVWALNLKRGVLSMLQNTMRRFDVDHRDDELDVNGICETTYRLQEARKTSLILKKTKNLAGCNFAAKHLSVIQSVPYKSPRSSSRIANQPLLKSNSECEITIDHNVYEKVVCKDSHLLQPFSNGEKAGVRTESTATLELIEESEYPLEDDDYNSSEEENHEGDQRGFKFLDNVGNRKRSSLLYDHSKTPRTMHGELRTSRDLLKVMCKLAANSDEIQQKFSETFTAFIHSARLLDYPSLSQLFARANGICPSGKKHIMSALPFMGSNPAVNVMKDLILKKLVDKSIIEKWVTTFALIPRPDLNTIKTLAPLLDLQHEIPEVQFSLSYAAVIHAYCSNHDVACANIEPISKFLSQLETEISKGCSPRPHSDDEKTNTLIALKATGNMGLETKSLLSKLKSCIDDEGAFLPMEMRVAAIDAHRRLPSCERTRDEVFSKIYRNFTLDSELRIASYLQVMHCPDYNIIKTIKATLRNEEVNQVGSFVWSHLTNLYSSASPTRVEIQSLLTDRDIGLKFNNDIRKFSRNYDSSFFSEEYNFGANSQTNLIFSQKSYIPRTVNLNVTIDLFGESVNLFEVSTRLEGIEFYAENLFGPEGPYSNEKVSNHFKAFMRNFRAAPEEDEDYWKSVKKLPNVIDNNFDNPQISLSYKIFGNELKYTTFSGDEEIRAALATLNPLTKIKQILSGQEVHYENSIMFADSSYVVPMTSGLPVRLDVAGSAAYNFKLSGWLDTNRFSTLREIEVFAKIIPSISVDIVSSMTVDAFYKSAGIKLRGNVYSSSSVQVELKVSGARLVQLSLTIPNHKMEVFSVMTDIVMTSVNGAEIEERPIGVLVTEQHPREAKRLVTSGAIISNTTCTWAALDRLIGLKMCTEYQFPNVTNDPSSSYFILKGPTLFKVSLIKADPTATNYLLQYRWDRTVDKSALRIAFDTPGSHVNRELSGSISFDAKTHNVSILLHSAGNSLVAKGTYKSTDDETFIDVGFDINGTKHLDASIGYSRKQFSYGYIYYPKLHLTINSERVAAITGTVKNGEKNNVSQCDIDLTFQTKRVWSKLIGYIVKRNTSISGDFQLNYQLQKMPRKETLHLEVSLTNRSSKTLSHKAAELKLHSTAYPQLNTVINAWYQQALGHLELHVEVNSSPYLKDNRHTLVAQLVLSYSKVYFQNEGTKVSLLFAITKPIQNLDIKVGVNHYAVGPESKSSLLIGYAPGKEISLMVSTLIPRGTMFALEGHANLTIPNFNSLLIDARITEKSTRFYDLYFAGTWFSGHNITARGTYLDKSTAVVTNHNLKLILKSPSFVQDVLVALRLEKGPNDFETSLQVEQVDLQKHALIVRYRLSEPTAERPETKLMGYVEGRYKKHVYSVLANIDLERQAELQLHLDNWRDVHLTLTGIREENKKEFGVEVKWDANRDPTLKIASYLRINKDVSPDVKTYGSVLTFTYPGRLINGSCYFSILQPYQYVVEALLDWHPEKQIKFNTVFDYDVESERKLLKVGSRLLTPFEQWKETGFSLRYTQTENSLEAVGGANWKDSQYLKGDFYGKIAESDRVREWSVNTGLTSTLHAVGHMTVNGTYKLEDSKNADAKVLIKYFPDKVIDVRSTWHLNKEPDSVFDITGTLHLESPVVYYRNGDMKCQLRILPDWRFNGAAYLELENRKYTASLLGDLAKLKESMVQLNLTTPIEKYTYIRSRFGLSETNRNVVAEVVTPSAQLGFEILLQMFTATHDCNIKLFLATPMDILQRSLLVAKLSKQEADFRIAYNDMTIGFQGVWHFSNITDFHHSYIIFTPLTGLEETGVIAKLIVTRLQPISLLDVETEFSVRLGDSKFGLKAGGAPKPPPVRIEVEDPEVEEKKVEKKEKDINEEEEEDEDDDEEEDEVPIYWRGQIEIFPLLFEPIVGELDIDTESNHWYKATSALHLLGNWKITLEDRLKFNLIDMQNELNIHTPFSISDITSSYAFNIDFPESIILAKFDFNLEKNGIWFENGYFLSGGTKWDDEDGSKTHTIVFNVKTSLEFLKFMNTTTIIHIDENLQKSSFQLTTDQCKANLFSSWEAEENFLDTTLSAEINSPELRIPKITLMAKKDFTDKERQLNFSFSVAHPVNVTSMFQATWLVTKENLKGSLKLNTWLEPLKNIGLNGVYVNNEDAKQLNLSFSHHQNEEYKISGNRTKDGLHADIYTPIESQEHFQFKGDLNKVTNALFEVNGDLTNMKTLKIYNVICKVTLDGSDISSVETSIIPNHGTEKEKLTLKLDRKKFGGDLAIEGPMVNGVMSVQYQNAINWNVRTKVETKMNLDDKIKEKYLLNIYMNMQVNGNASLYLNAETPWPNIKVATLNGNALIGKNMGEIKLTNKLNYDIAHLTLAWKMLVYLDMFGRIAGGYDIGNYGSKELDVQAFYKSPEKSLKHLNIGFDVDIDKENWKFGVNATTNSKRELNKDLNIVVLARLPPPTNDHHTMALRYQVENSFQDFDYAVEYSTLKTKTNYSSDGSLSMKPRNIDGHLHAIWGPRKELTNTFNVTFDKKQLDLEYIVSFPKVMDKKTATVLFSYDGRDNNKNLINADIFYPEKHSIGTARISYESIINVNGTVNTTVPVFNLTYVGCSFIVRTTLKQNRRFLEVFWPNNTALINSDYIYHSERLDSNLDGVFLIEVPLNTRHVGDLKYGYKKTPLLTSGYSLLSYNGQKIVDGKYNAKSESRAGFEKDSIKITVENVLKPIGIDYTNQYEYSGGNEGTNYPTTEFKRVFVYQLGNVTAFNVAGESKIKTTHTGQEIYLKAIHSNRTIQLKTNYEVLSGEFDQNTWLSLADDAWISYHINILNKTTEEVDNQFLIASIAYPRRNFTFNGSYRFTSQELNSEGQLIWDQDKELKRILGAEFNCKSSLTKDNLLHQEAVLMLKHPTFAKNVTAKGRFFKNDLRDLFNADFVVDYSNNPDKLFQLSTLLRDETVDTADTKYSYHITGKHPKTKFNLEIDGFLQKQRDKQSFSTLLVELKSKGKYKRTFLPEEIGQVNAKVDVLQKEIILHRESKELLKYFHVRYYPTYPQYVVNGSVINTPSLNATGHFFFDPKDKFTWMMVNYTPDAIESLRMYGKIPDARNAVFDIWRTYDNDLTVSDVSFYLKLNHSRLVTSTLRWRPDLKTDIMNSIKGTITQLYEGTNRDIDYWKQYIKSETVSIISDVWEDSQDELYQFVDDWNNLKGLEKDFDDLRVYLNDSYNANDFYIKDIVGFGLYVIDELSLRHHIQSLPNILNEIWEIMGESGEAIRQSLIWAIKAIKSGFQKISEIVSAVLRGDSIAQVAEIIEKIVEKYDLLIKDLHVSFIKYIENLWNKTWANISQQWYKFLKLVEPIFIRLLHYLEAVVWKASKEIVDFLYDRRNEIMTSPYFDRFTNFTHDIDRFYKDIKANDIVTNVQKYSNLLIQFLKERYFTFVPFGKELKDIVEEIISELKELKKLPSIHYALDKMNIVYDRAYYFYEYFGIQAKIEGAVRLVHSKLMDISQSALQAESRYREAKTKFIFDPHQGLMCLEQKLPMSWHAFNQTPEFQEIPEYRAISDMGNFFVTSNTTFWSLYYQYKPYTEPSNWLPPFKAQAMIIGSQHFTTFDGRHFDFAGTCSYLLARDFVHDTFAILLKYNKDSANITHKIIVLIADKALELDVFNDTVRLISSRHEATTNLQLPLQLANNTIYVYQKENVVTIERKTRQFRLECNLKYDLCTLELSGWYFGKTAGLLGTMNNEEQDDTLSSKGVIAEDIEKFSQSWAVNDEKCEILTKPPVTATDEISKNNSMFCEEFFVNKSSEFSSCFRVIDPSVYAKLCKSNPEDSCKAAVSYIQACLFRDTYLRIPDKCTSCMMMDGSKVAEGEFRKLEGQSVPKSADVVFIVEAKECNTDIKQNRSIEQLVTQLNKELRDQQLTEIRWSLVTFGGDGVYDLPRSVILDSEIFTKNPIRFVDYFQQIPVGNGNQDIFAAIGFASQLIFRPGVSKTFILLPCSHCEPENQTLDYSVLHQVLLEHDVTLHILMDGDFQFEKERMNKILFGLDASKSYTKKDARALVGDVELRRQVKLSKSALGYCTPLSLESNGTIFSGSKLRFEKAASIKKFASVFSKRVALTAQPNPCQRCECIADNNGATSMECIPCIYPTPVIVDYISETFNETISLFQPLDADGHFLEHP